MTPDPHRELRRFLLAYEQLDAAWRIRYDLTANEKLVVLFLAEGTSSPAELARSIGMSTAGMTGLLDRLESDGFVRRQPHGTDRRRVLLTLTKQGLKARLDFEQATARMAELVPDEAREVIGTFLEAAVQVADDITEQVGNEQRTG